MIQKDSADDSDQTSQSDSSDAGNESDNETELRDDLNTASPSIEQSTRAIINLAIRDATSKSKSTATNLANL